LGVASGWLVVAPRAVPAVLVLPVAYFALPFDLMSSSFLDMRAAVMFGFLVPAALEPVRGPSSRFVTAFALPFSVRMAVLAQVWIVHRNDLAELRAVIAAVPPSTKVYFTNVPQEEAPA